MHTISMLRRTLGLSSDNQVRNRIERIKDLLSEHIRRGPNNQIFLTDPGLDLMKQFQELYDTGLTLAEASNVLHTNSLIDESRTSSVSSSFSQNRAKPANDLIRPESTITQQLNRIQEQLGVLERQVASSASANPRAEEPQPWWSRLREDVDVS